MITLNYEMQGKRIAFHIPCTCKEFVYSKKLVSCNGVEYVLQDIEVVDKEGNKTLIKLNDETKLVDFLDRYVNEHVEAATNH